MASDPADPVVVTPDDVRSSESDAGSPSTASPSVASTESPSKLRGSSAVSKAMPADSNDSLVVSLDSAPPQAAAIRLTSMSNAARPAGLMCVGRHE